MAIEVTLPRQGWSMEEAVFVEWFKKDGDEVRVGEPLFAVETDKSVQEIESLDAGILRLAPNAPKKGDTVRVAEVFGYLLAPGEALPTGTSAPAPAQEAAMPPSAKAACHAAPAPDHDHDDPQQHLPERGQVFQPGDGIVGNNVDETIRNIGRIAAEGMVSTDHTILNIMTHQANA